MLNIPFTLVIMLSMSARKQKSISHRLIKVFIPHRHNNYSPWISRIPGLLSIMAVLVLLHFGINSLGLTSIDDGKSDGKNTQLLEQVNKRRKEAGAQPLKIDKRLDKAAQEKAEHMISNDYWAHVGPDGIEAWSFLAKNKYFYQEAAENLARGFRTPDGVAAGWMASPAHKKAMLNPAYTEVGFGKVDGRLSGEDTTVVVGMFAKPLEGATVSSATSTKNAIALQGQASRFVTGNDAVEFSLLNPISLHSTLTLPGEIALIILSILVLIYLIQHIMVRRRNVVWYPKVHQQPVLRILIIIGIIVLIISTSFGSIG